MLASFREQKRIAAVTRDRRDSYPTIPDGRMAVDHQQTLLWMEIGEHAVYSVGPRDGSATIVELRVSQTLIRDIPYVQELGLKIQFVLASSRAKAGQAASDAGVDELLGIRTASARPSPPIRLPYTFVKIENVPKLRNIKRLWARPHIALAHHAEPWLLEIEFPNIVGVPRILRPSSGPIISF